MVGMRTLSGELTSAMKNLSTISLGGFPWVADSFPSRVALFCKGHSDCPWKQTEICLTLLHSERPKLCRVLAVLSGIGSRCFPYRGQARE